MEMLDRETAGRGHAGYRPSRSLRRPLRLFGSLGHCLNWVIGIAAFVLLLVPALLFYGASMLLAAVRGYGGCELFAASNRLFKRDDQIACPVFTPIDAVETRSLHR